MKDMNEQSVNFDIRPTKKPIYPNLIGLAATPGDYQLKSPGRSLSRLRQVIGLSKRDLVAKFGQGYRGLQTLAPVPPFQGYQAEPTHFQSSQRQKGVVFPEGWQRRTAILRFHRRASLHGFCNLQIGDSWLSPVCQSMLFLHWKGKIRKLSNADWYWRLISPPRPTTLSLFELKEGDTA